LDLLAADLDRIRHNRAPRLVIHGDFTTHNVVATGRPPVATGVIDFALAYVEAPLADIGFGLWRSGRPHQRASHLDLRKARDFVSGYCQRRPLAPEAAQAVAVYLRARGIQQAIKGRIRGRSPGRRLAERIRWLSAHRPAVEDCLHEAIEAAIGR
jgi:Ser/Thr protein kinase RdoA (MazF antagonist)